MDKFLQIVQLVGTCLSILVVVIIPMILYLWKKVKELIAAPSNKKPTVLLDIYNNVVQYIQDAEKMFTEGTSKKSWVLSQIKNDCISASIEYDADYWTKLINKEVAMTKKVNVAK